jgi:hypothetical protein
MQTVFTGTSDIHRWPPTHRFKPLKDFDVLGGIRFSAALAARFKKIGHRPYTELPHGLTDMGAL